MKHGYLCAGALLLGILLAASVAHAHTTIASSIPASGSILTASPPAISLNFHAPVRLTALDVVTMNAERRLPFEPMGKARTFTAKAPALVPGRNEIRWRALSQDGHVIEGSLIVVVRPASP